MKSRYVHVAAFTPRKKLVGTHKLHHHVTWRPIHTPSTHGPLPSGASQVSTRHTSSVDLAATACYLKLTHSCKKVLEVCLTRLHCRHPQNQKRSELHNGIICGLVSDVVAADDVDCLNSGYAPKSHGLASGEIPLQTHPSLHLRNTNLRRLNQQVALGQPATLEGLAVPLLRTHPICLHQKRQHHHPIRSQKLPPRS
jgi:hypothetical protein